MGYDLHITRKVQWSDPGNDISVEEWLEVVQDDPELSLYPENRPYFTLWKQSANESWLDWHDGNIYSKNPDKALIDKMINIAKGLRAHVQGDDGEIYGESEGEKRTSHSPMKNISKWFIMFFQPKLKISHKDFQFKVGDKAKDLWGEPVTIVRILPRAEHGAGIVRFRYVDGREMTNLMIAHGLIPIENKKK